MIRYQCLAIPTLPPPSPICTHLHNSWLQLFCVSTYAWVSWDGREARRRAACGPAESPRLHLADSVHPEAGHPPCDATRRSRSPFFSLSSVPTSYHQDIIQAALCTFRSIPWLPLPRFSLPTLQLRTHAIISRKLPKRALPPPSPPPARVPHRHTPSGLQPREGWAAERRPSPAFRTAQRD